MGAEYNVLIGVPPEGSVNVEHKLERCIRIAAADKDVRFVIFVRTVADFCRELTNKVMKYSLIVAIDDLGMGGEYSQYLKMAYPTMCIVIIPDRCYGSEQLSCLLAMGINNVLFQRDVGIKAIQSLIHNNRSAAAANAYCGFDLRPVPHSENTNTVQKEKTGLNIQKRNLGQGVTVTRLFSQDSKLLQNKNLGDDEVISSFLDGYDLENNTEKMKQLTFEQDPEWMQPFKDKLRVYFRQNGLAVFQGFENGDVTKDQFTDKIMKELDKQNIDETKAVSVCQSFMRDILSYGKLDVVINTEGISDIRLINRNTVNVQYKGEWYKTNIHFDSEEEYLYFINRICTKNHAAVNIQQAQVIFTDIVSNPKARLRFMVTHGMLSAASTSTAHIRLIDKVKKTAPQLVEEGFWTAKQAGFLINAVKHRKSIIVCGGSGSGKTIEINCLIEYLNNSICGSCIQESDELFSHTKSNIEFLHSVAAKGESKVEYTLRQLCTAALLKNAELFMIGEIKGDEARDFFTAAITGAMVMCTTHADDVFAALPRIADLAKYSGDYSQKDILKLLAKSIDYVVYNENYGVKQIAAVVGYDEEKEDVIYDLYDFGEELA